MIEQKSLEVESTVLIGIINSKQQASKAQEYLDELDFGLYRWGKSIEALYPKY